MGVKTGYSTVTVYQAYSMLESEGTLTARPRSGFFVSDSARPLPEFDLHADKRDREEPEDTNARNSEWRQTWQMSGDFLLGSTRVSDDIMPYDELYRYYVKQLRWESARLESVPWNGSAELREIIAKRLGGAVQRAHSDDILIEPNIEHAVGNCLSFLDRPNGKFLVETPTDGATISALLKRKSKLVEIYSHPRWGIDPDQFEYLLKNNDISACLISPHNHPPTGVSYSIETARRIVQIASAHQVPIVENMADRDLLFGTPAFELSQFDSQNLVIRIGSFSETLGSLFGLGWIVLPRKYRAQASAVASKQFRLAGYNAVQKAVAEFIERRNYERHRRRLQETLGARVQKGLSLVFQNFPDSCTVSRPQGGYLCWVRGPVQFNSIKAQSSALKTGTSFIPGPVFSVTGSFENFLALNLSHPWTAEREQDVAKIGALLHKATKK
jgi:DNA-binding transcriptional MocR family regulator